MSHLQLSLAQTLLNSLLNYPLQIRAFRMKNFPIIIKEGCQQFLLRNKAAKYAHKKANLAIITLLALEFFPHS